MNKPRPTDFDARPGSQQTRWSQERKAEKKCLSCGKPVKFYALCDACNSKQRERMRLRRAA